MDRQFASGHFWCEQFKGDHISVDYHWNEPYLTVQGFKSDYTYTRWDKWIKIDHCFDLPPILNTLHKKYEWINCEFIGGKLIEVHLRSNPDFGYNNSEFIPVWKNQSVCTEVQPDDDKQDVRMLHQTAPETNEQI